MKKIIIALSGIALYAALTTAHQATLSWTLSTDDIAANCTSTTCSQTVYRATGACSASSAFVVIDANLAPSATTYTDTTILPGIWCYGVSFSENSLESAKATVTVSLPPAAPLGLVGNAT